MKAVLSKISLHGFKSFGELSEFHPGQINMLIGANGAGKSNFISFFRMLSWMMSGTTGSLQDFVGRFGPASRILHGGPKVSPILHAGIEITTDSGKNDYAFSLAYASNDTLIFTDEKYRFSHREKGEQSTWRSLGAGHLESKLHLVQEGQNQMPGKTMKTIRNLLRGLVVYQFHDTSFLSRIRGKWSCSDNRYLKEDGGNLAAFLMGLRDSEDPQAKASFLQTESLVKQIAPFFNGFVLEPEGSQVLLQWRERGTDMVFSASQASDGFLRNVALLALLSQPNSSLSPVILLDEPELGLHPFAINVVAALIRQVAVHSQLFVATQSPLLLDSFEPEEVVVVSRRPGGTELERKPVEELAAWRDEYSLGEIWRKNLLGGGPAE
jgi:predicted ATPase